MSSAVNHPKPNVVTYKPNGAYRPQLPVHKPATPAVMQPERSPAVTHLRYSPDQPHTPLDALAVVRRTLNSDIEWLHDHTRLQDRAREWHAAGRTQTRLLMGDDITFAREWIARRPKDAPAPTELQYDFISASEMAEEARLQPERQRVRRMREALESAERDLDLISTKEEQARMEAEQNAVLRAEREHVRWLQAQLERAEAYNEAHQDEDRMASHIRDKEAAADKAELQAEHDRALRLAQDLADAKAAKLLADAELQKAKRASDAELQKAKRLLDEQHAADEAQIRAEHARVMALQAELGEAKNTIKKDIAEVTASKTTVQFMVFGLVVAFLLIASFASWVYRILDPIW